MNLSPRQALTFVSANNAPTGFPWAGEAMALGTEFCEATTGRKFRFCKFLLSGVSCKMGTPVVAISTFGVVTPDLSDATTISAGVAASHVFAGIALASHAPTSGSTTYGWVMSKGPLGNIAGSHLSGVTVRTVISGAISSKNGMAYSLSTVDGLFTYPSTAATRVMPNLVRYGAAVTTQSQSVTAGHINSWFW